MSNAEIASLVISLISIAVSVTVSVIIYFWSKKDTSTDYKLKDVVIKDLLDLEGNLNCILVKAKTSNLISKLDLDKEIEFIKNFLVSPTMCFILTYDNCKDDEAFYLDLFLISSGKDNNIIYLAGLAQEVIKMLNNICKTKLIDKLKKISSVDCLQAITHTQEQVNILLKSAKENVEKSIEIRTKLIKRQLKHLKNKGIQDPYIDLFLTIVGKEEPDKKVIDHLCSECIKEYGRLDVTDKEILEKYKDYLKDFKYDDNLN